MIRRIMIANRGLCAYKFIMSIRDFCIERNQTLELYAIVTDNDLSSKYRYIEHADYAIYCKDDDVYMNPHKIVELCKKHQVDAVYPGWGYLSESAVFSNLLAANQIVFIGPTGESIETLGNKIKCMKLAEELHVPLLPWSGVEPLVDYPQVAAWADRIGFPVFIKDADGGGGKGIRIVRTADELEDSYNSMLLECKARTVPSIFVMKLAQNCRHLEIQLVGDGVDAIHLFGRDCTLQRRNQKLFEEGPITVVDPAQIERLQRCSVEMVRAVHFRGVCTAEFLYEMDTGEMTFLEINPRLQVEHIVTEMMTGLNLPAIQYQIAAGWTIDQITELVHRPSAPLYHVVAARVNAEDPEHHFRPSTGALHDLTTEYTPSTWGYFSIDKHGRILSTTDSQFGHVFASGRDRREAMG